MECQVFHIATDGTVTQLDHADGAFRASPATPKVPLVEVGTTGLFIRAESREPAWADGNYVLIANVVGMASPDGGVEFEMKFDAEVRLDSPPSALLAFLEKLTALVDIGSGILAELGPITMEKGENKVITIQVLENGSPKDCTGYTAKLGVKGAAADTDYKFTPVDGVFSNDVNGVKSIVTFTIAPDTTKAMTPFGGVYSAAIYDALGKKYPLPPERGGLPFVLKEDVLDVA